MEFAMRDRERLIELIKNAPTTDTVYGNIKLETPIQTVQTIADHLLANGVIVPPCKVGDRVYSINIGDEKTLKIWIEPNGDRITQIKINRGGYHFKCWWGYFHLSDIGKSIFLTKEEAEQALKGLKDNVDL